MMAPTLPAAREAVDRRLVELRDALDFELLSVAELHLGGEPCGVVATLLIEDDGHLAHLLVRCDVVPRRRTN